MSARGSARARVETARGIMRGNENLEQPTL